MDLRAMLGQFTGPDGNFHFPEDFNLALLSESLFLAEMGHGVPDRPQLTYHQWGEDGHTTTVYTRHQLNTRIKTVAARLTQIAEPGSRVAIMANNSPEYIYGFLGAVYANLTPVPLYDPNEPGHAAHLAAVLETSAPSVVITNKASAAAVRTYFADRPASARPRILSVDALPDIDPFSFEVPDYTASPEGKAGIPPVDQLSFLQFTSGSTRKPAGVEITHRQVVTNALQIFHHGRFRLPGRVVLWLPLHHDMGLILAAFFTLLGQEIDLLSPRDMVQHPSRWIRLMSHRGTDGTAEGTTAVYSVGPNFSLGLAARFANPVTTEGLENLDLSAVEALVCGAEPVTEPVIREFLAAFEPAGFPRTSLRCGYGMAEASLLISTPISMDRPKVVWVDRAALGAGQVTPVADVDPLNPPEGVTAIISQGEAAPPQVAVIVDPETRQEVADGTVGEIWVSGANVARGYLDQPEDTAETFGNKLPGAARRDGSRAAHLPDDADWLATGDLGVFFEGELYVTGRLKDLIVVGGRNHYPQDIELTTQLASDQVRPEAVAAFAVDGEDVEKLVILAERNLTALPDGDAAAIDAIRAAVTSQHGVSPADIRIVEINSIPRSSAAKIARRVAKAAYLDGVFS